EAAGREYAAMREGTSRLQLRHGALVARNRLRALNPLWRMSLLQRMALAVAGVGAIGATAVLLATSTLAPWLAWAFVAAATAAAGYCAWWLWKDVVGRLDAAVAHLRDFACGDYVRDIDIDRDDEVGR